MRRRTCSWNTRPSRPATNVSLCALWEQDIKFSIYSPFFPLSASFPHSFYLSLGVPTHSVTLAQSGNPYLLSLTDEPAEEHVRKEGQTESHLVIEDPPERPRR